MECRSISDIIRYASDRGWSSYEINLILDKYGVHSPILEDIFSRPKLRE